MRASASPDLPRRYWAAGTHVMFQHARRGPTRMQADEVNAVLNQITSALRQAMARDDIEAISFFRDEGAELCAAIDSAEAGYSTLAIQPKERDL